MNIVAIGTVSNFKQNSGNTEQATSPVCTNIAMSSLYNIENQLSGHYRYLMAFYQRSVIADHLEVLTVVRVRKHGQVGEGRVQPLTSEDSLQHSAGRARKQGWKVGVGQRLRRLELLSIIVGNVQSLRNKIDKLQTNVKYMPEYKNTCVIALTESWLKEHDLSQDYELDGFGQPSGLNREEQLTRKTQGGGVALYVNQRWYKTVVVRESI